MQWPDKKADAPIKPYNRNRCKLTAANCAIDVSKQVRLYAEWANEESLKKVHIFPPGKTGYARFAFDELLKQEMHPDTRLVDVNPADWGFK